MRAARERRPGLANVPARAPWFPALRQYVEGNGYEVVALLDGSRSAVPMDTIQVLAELERAEQMAVLLREWLTYTGLRQRAFDPDLDPDDDEYASGRDLIRRTDAALSEATDSQAKATE